MSKRLEAIQKMLAKGNTEPFTRYAFAMELKSLGRNEESLAAFEELRTTNPEYVPQYLLAGGVCEALGQKDVAKIWYEQGIERAKKSGDSHALSELQSALSLVGEV